MQALIPRWLTEYRSGWFVGDLSAGVVVALMLVALRIGTLVGTRRAYEAGGLGYWLSPFADLLAWLVVARRAFAPSRQWRGRTY
ncbi:MAG: hypothetical protein EBX62_12235 [Betaproteobacteria bacterium]|nr:hypothetical protein [Betaproteobacteria bacterium]